MVLRMLATTSSIFTPVVVAPSVPQSISMCAGAPFGSKVSKKQSPSPCRYIRTRTGIAPVTDLRGRTRCVEVDLRAGIGLSITAVHNRERLKTLNVERAEIYCSERFARLECKSALPFQPTLAHRTLAYAVI